MTTYLEYRNGFAATEQDLIIALDDFLLTQVGTWERVYKIADTSSDRNYVFKSVTSNSDLYRSLYVRWRAYSASVYIGGYTYYDSDGTYTDEISPSSAYTGSSFYYYLFADADSIWVIMHTGVGQWYYAYTGLFNSYYNMSLEDRYPLALVINTSESYSFTDNIVTCYGPWVLSSGTSYTYKTNIIEYSSMLEYAEPSDRSGVVGICPAVLYRDSFPEEVRGELKNTWLTSGVVVSPNTWHTVSGTNDKYYGVSYYADVSKSFFVGPIPASSGTDWL